jgi:hypothetical protein
MEVISDDLKNRYDVISTKLNGFGLGRIQEYRGLMVTLKALEISDDEFRDWVDYATSPERYRANLSRSKRFKGKHYFCPDCGDMMHVLAVNTMPCNNVGEDYKSMFSCHDVAGCGYSRYSNKPVSEWRELLYQVSAEDSNGKMVKESKGCGGCGSK